MNSRKGKWRKVGVLSACSWDYHCTLPREADTLESLLRDSSGQACLRESDVSEDQGSVREPGAGWQCRKAMDPWRHRTSPQAVAARLRDAVWVQLVPLDKLLISASTRELQSGPSPWGTGTHLSAHPSPGDLLQGDLSMEMPLEHPLLYFKWILRPIQKDRYMFIYLINSIQKPGESMASKEKTSAPPPRQRGAV